MKCLMNKRRKNFVFDRVFDIGYWILNILCKSFDDFGIKCKIVVVKKMLLVK